MGFNKKVKEAAHSHFSEGSEQPKGFKPRAMYEEKKASFIAGALWAKNYKLNNSKESKDLENYLLKDKESNQKFKVVGEELVPILDMFSK